jgi:hypothetical protein
MIALFLCNEDLQSLSQEMMLIAGIIRTWFQSHAAKSSFKRQEANSTELYETTRLSKPDKAIRYLGAGEHAWTGNPKPRTKITD